MDDKTRRARDAEIERFKAWQRRTCGECFNEAKTVKRGAVAGWIGPEGRICAKCAKANGIVNVKGNSSSR